MTHDEMIEAIKAHNEGKRLEYRLSWNNGNGQWLQLDNFNEHFDFSIYEYRIKPKETEFKPKFKVGDFVLSKDRENTPINQELHEILGIEPDTYFIDDPCLSEIAFEDEDKYIKADDCLWYWEYYDQIDKKYKSSLNERQTKEEAIRSLNIQNYSDLQPLYVIGFRLPKDKKCKHTN